MLTTSSRRTGLIAIRLNDDDELAEVVPTNGLDDILLSSRLGQTIRFSESRVREMGRARGRRYRLEVQEGW